MRSWLPHGQRLTDRLAAFRTHDQTVKILNKYQHHNVTITCEGVLEGGEVLKKRLCISSSSAPRLSPAQALRSRASRAWTATTTRLSRWDP